MDMIDNAKVVGKWIETHRYVEEMDSRMPSEDDKMLAAWKMLNLHPELEKVRVYGGWCGYEHDDCDTYDRRGFYLDPNGNMAYSWRYVRNVDCAEFKTGDRVVGDMLSTLRISLVIAGVGILVALLLSFIF